jgi:hypothetical protein
MRTALKIMLAASATIFVSAPAYATNFNLVATPTGGGDYTYDISDTAAGKGTFADTFTFTIPGAIDGTIDVGALNVANPTSNSNINFVSGFLSGTPTNTPLTVTNAGPLSIISNSADISVMAGLTYVVHVTYQAAAKNAAFNGNVSFQAAPEPATWALMLLGFGVVGAGMRRSMRPKQTVAVHYA